MEIAAEFCRRIRGYYPGLVVRTKGQITGPNVYYVETAVNPSD